jgi:hypothetical protein
LHGCRFEAKAEARFDALRSITFAAPADPGVARVIAAQIVSDREAILEA